MDLFAHVCEVMGLFPTEGNEALAELVGRMKAGRLSGAAVKGDRRAGYRDGGPVKRRSRE